MKMETQKKNQIQNSLQKMSELIFSNLSWLITVQFANLPKDTFFYSSSGYEFPSVEILHDYKDKSKLFEIQATL